jgi:hypothetical protein
MGPGAEGVIRGGVSPELRERLGSRLQFADADAVSYAMRLRIIAGPGSDRPGSGYATLVAAHDP